MSTVQCYTPSGGPSCRTQGLGSAVAHKDYYFVFFWVFSPWSPPGSRAVALQVCRLQGLFFCLLLGSASLVSHGRCRPNKDYFFGFYLVFGLCTVMKQRLVFRVLVGLVRICTANSRVLLYGV